MPIKKDQDLLLTIGRQMRAQRQRLGLSQEALAEKAGFHRTYIGMVERGEQNITILSFFKFAQALDLQCHELLGISLGAGNLMRRDTPTASEQGVCALVKIDESTFANDHRPVCVLDLEGRFVHVNAKYCKLLGFTNTQLEGQPLDMVHPPACLHELQANVANMVHGFLFVSRIPLLTKKGDVVPAETRITRGYWRQMPVLIGMVQVVYYNMLLTV